MIRYFKAGRRYETDSLLAAAGIEEEEYPVISGVGAGGKTSTIRRLAEEYAASGRGAVVLTTTHMKEEKTPWSCVAEEEEWKKDPVGLLSKMKQILKEYRQVWIGTRTGRGRVKCVPEEILTKIGSWKIPLLVEADGARMLPLKVPGEREPVLHPRTTHVFAVYGMDAVGKPLEEVCFRSEQAARLLGKKVTDLVTESDLVNLACHDEGGRKGCSGQMKYLVVLNKADTKERQIQAQWIAEQLEEKKAGRILITSYKM